MVQYGMADKTGEQNEVSIQEVRVFAALSSEWQSSKELHGRVKDVAERTVRAKLLKFVQLGLADHAEVFPGHRYRLSAFAAKRNGAYLQRLKRAAEVFHEQ